MSDDEHFPLSLAEIDSDGAVREAASRLPTRAQFLRLGGSAALGGLAFGVMPGFARAQQKESRSDVAILNFALSLEYLQAAFYSEAQKVGALSGGLATQARIVGSHERAHVRAFRTVLGSAAIKAPSFDFHGTTDSPDSFRTTAVAFEDLAVAAYKEQLPKIRSDQYLATAVAIHSVEARHASWIRRLAGIVPAPDAFDQPSSDRRTVRLVNSTRFVTLHLPTTSAKRSPSFTG
jgi:rubrerythrin